MINWKNTYQKQNSDLHSRAPYKNSGYSNTSSLYQGKGNSSIQSMSKPPTYWRESRKANPTPSRYSKTTNFSNHCRMNKNYSKPCNLNIGQQSVSSFGNSYNENGYKKNPYSSTAQLGNNYDRKYTPLRRNSFQRRESINENHKGVMKAVNETQNVQSNFSGDKRNMSSVLNETDITYTNYSGDILCIRGSGYTKRLHEDLKMETSEEKLQRILKEHEDVTNGASSQQLRVLQPILIDHNIQEKTEVNRNFSKKRKFNRSVHNNKHKQIDYRNMNGIKDEYTQNYKETFRTEKNSTLNDNYTGDTSSTENNKTPLSYKTSSIDSSEERISTLDRSGYDKSPITNTSPFSYSEILKNKVDNDLLNKEREDITTRDFRRNDEDSRKYSLQNQESLHKTNTFNEEDKIFDESKLFFLNLDMMKFNSKLKFLENKLIEIEMGRTSRKLKRSQPTASSGDNFTQTYIHSMVKTETTYNPVESTLSRTYEKYSEIRRNSFSKPNVDKAIPQISEYSPQKMIRAPLNQLNRNYSQANSRVIPYSKFTQSQNNFNRIEEGENNNKRQKIKIPKFPTKKTPIKVFNKGEIKGEKGLRNSNVHSLNSNQISHLSSFKRRNKYTGSCKESAELQRMKEVEKYIQAANRSQTGTLNSPITTRSITPNKLPHTSSKVKLGENVKSKSEFKPKKGIDDFVKRASKKALPPSESKEEKPIEGQVSYLERIAEEHYTKKRVNHLSPFGQFLGDCKEQMILSRRCQQYLRSRPFKGKKVRFKRDFKSILLSLLL